MEHIMENLFISKDIDGDAKKYIELLECSTYIDNIKNIKKDWLYKSKFHGLYHSEKVAFHCCVLGMLKHLSDEDMQIIIDAGLYHDIGRSNDNEDNFHGYVSANKIDEIINGNPIYDVLENRNILKAIIDGHSRNEDKKEITAEDYDIVDYERYSLLYDILKDADALDRTRFNSLDSIYLNEKYLRLDESKKLISIATSLNNYYRDKIKINTYNNLGLKNIKDTNVGCIHGIGYDIYKLRSILINGILSSDEMAKKNIVASRNFLGANKYFWISVIDDKIVGNNSGFNKFINDGISIYCFVQMLVDGIDPKSGSIANDTGMPIKSMEHIDEKFVYNEIPVENIYAILLPKNRIHDTLGNLTYINCNLRYQIILDKTMYYYNMIKQYFNYECDTTKVNEILKEYKETTESSSIISNSDLDNYYKKLESLASSIDECIKSWHTLASINKYGRELKLFETVEIVFSSANVNYQKIDSGNELIYKLNLTKKIENDKKKLKK